MRTSNQLYWRPSRICVICFCAMIFLTSSLAISAPQDSPLVEDVPIDGSKKPTHVGVGQQYGETYTNPLGPRLADPCIQKFGDFYYIFGTPAPGNRELNWTPLWKSRDMINWSGPHVIYESDTEGVPHWASDGYHYNGKYYVVTTRGFRARKGTIAIIVADQPEGPYTLHTNIPQKRLDPGIFVDTDGKSYFLLDEHIAPLSEDWKTIGEWANRPFGEQIIEGPFMIKHNNRYHMFRAQNGKDRTGYQLKMGYADHPLGEYTIWDRNPVYDGKFRPGHGGYTASPDGTQLWLVCHCFDKKTSAKWANRWLMVDHWGGFDADGWPKKIAQNFGETKVPSRSVEFGDIAKGKMANANSFKEGMPPSNAIDGDPSSAWESNGNDGQRWLEVDLAGEFRIQQLQIDFLQKPTAFSVLGTYDRYRWTMLAEDAMDFDSDTHWRYIRIASNEDFGIKEVSIVHKNPNPFLGYSDHVVVDVDRTLTKAGERLKLEETTIPSTGVYDIEFQVASTDLRNSWNLYCNGQKLTSQNIGNTWFPDDWKSSFAYDVILEQGPCRLELELLDDNCNFKNIVIHRVRQSDHRGVSSTDAGKLYGLNDRLAVSADGNINDPDDIGATCATLALIKAAGDREKLVYYGYNDHVWDAEDPSHIKRDSEGRDGGERMRISVRRSREQFGFGEEFDKVFFDVFAEARKPGAVLFDNPAVSALTNAINASSADSRLWIVMSGRSEIIYQALSRSNREKIKHVALVSHGARNNEHAAKFHGGHSWPQLKAIIINNGGVVHSGATNARRGGPDPQVNKPRGQNGNAKAGLGTRADATPFKDTGNADAQLVWDMMLLAEKMDISDAGMMYYLLTGQDENDFADLAAFILSEAP